MVSGKDLVEGGYREGPGDLKAERADQTGDGEAVTENGGDTGARAVSQGTVAAQDQVETPFVKQAVQLQLAEPAQLDVDDEPGSPFRVVLATM